MTHAEPGPPAKISQFVAENATLALTRIHEELGPDAVVLGMRRVPARGMARLWRKHAGIEMLAGLPAAPAVSHATIKPKAPLSFTEFLSKRASHEDAKLSRTWRGISWLETMGLLPDIANRLQLSAQKMHSASPPPDSDLEWKVIQTVLATGWRTPNEYSECDGRPHVFIGPPGSGKTTALCKWLTKSVLAGGKSACVWRLDTLAANTSEWLSVHCEMLGVPVERFWSASKPVELLFVDLPGIEVEDRAAFLALQNQMAAFSGAHVHLVLNAACETSILLEQFQSFAPLQPEDLIFTHLDEERQRAKLWNFVWGTNCSIRFLAAGQKIPGEFLTAKSELLFPSANAPKTAAFNT